MQFFKVFGDLILHKIKAGKVFFFLAICKDNIKTFTLNTQYRKYLLMLHSFHVLVSARLSASTYDASYMAQINKQTVFGKRAHNVDRR